jgi:hypothetical protein
MHVRAISLPNRDATPSAIELVYGVAPAIGVECYFFVQADSKVANFHGNRL